MLIKVCGEIMLWCICISHNGCWWLSTRVLEKCCQWTLCAHPTLGGCICKLSPIPAVLCAPVLSLHRSCQTITETQQLMYRWTLLSLSSRKADFFDSAVCSSTFMVICTMGCTFNRDLKKYIYDIHLFIWQMLLSNSCHYFYLVS